jgi:nucleoside phosphorylase
VRSAPVARAGAIMTVDVFHEIEGSRPRDDRDALAIEMEAAALFAVGVAEHVPVACVLTVSDTFDASGRRTRAGDESLLAAAERMGGAALAALAG